MDHDAPMTLAEHLGELRGRLMRAVVALVVAAAICFVYGYDVMKQILTAPLDTFDAATANPFARFNPLIKALAPYVSEHTLVEPVKLHAMTVMEVFNVKMKMALVGGLVLSAPVILYQMWAFIGAGLLARERRAILRYLPLSIALFVLGMVFAYIVAIPTALIYLLTIDPEVRLILMYGSYFSLITTLLAIFGLAFQLPLVTMALARLGIVPTRTLVRSWRYAVVIIFIAAAILTPSGDPFSLCLLALPLVGLYVLGIWLAKLGEKPAHD